MEYITLYTSSSEGKLPSEEACSAYQQDKREAGSCSFTRSQYFTWGIISSVNAEWQN